MPIPPPANPDPFRRLVEIMEALLAPEGCPWDRQQSHQSLKPYVIEEAYEVCDSIDDGDFEELKGELGDLGLQIVFHAALARREGHFAIDDVYEAICAKLIRRHPHVFGNVNADDAETVLRNWEQIKRQEREAKGAAEKPPSALDGVPKNLPALQRAQRLQAKAARVGFDWKEVAPVFAKIHEEIDEVEEAVKSIDLPAPVLSGGENPAKLSDHLPINHDEIFGELGDLLFAIVNLARFLRIDPEQALQSSNQKFLRRFHYIEQQLRARGKTPAESTLEEMDQLWEAAKRAR